MKLLESEKGIKIPLIYFVENESEIAKIPVGIPFIRGSSEDYSAIVQTIEFEILYKSALETGLDFKWFDILDANGFDNIYYDSMAFSERIIDEDSDFIFKELEGTSVDKDTAIATVDTTIKKVINEVYASYVVDLEMLKELEIIPTFLTDIEKAIEINIHNGYKFNSNLFNKKLGLPIGELEVSESKKNLIIIDISSSIPKSISKTILALSKTMSSQFYADLLITGSKSTLYEYDEVDSLNINKVYSDNGMDNDQVEFRKLVETDYRSYGTVICFGDNHSPGMSWSNAWNKCTKDIPLIKGKELCKWEVDSIISFHTTSEKDIAGYAEWFTCSDITYMKKWVTYFN